MRKIKTDLSHFRVGDLYRCPKHFSIREGSPGEHGILDLISIEEGSLLLCIDIGVFGTDPGGTPYPFASFLTSKGKIIWGRRIEIKRLRRIESNGI